MRHPNAWYGYKRDRVDARDHLFHPALTRLPACVDLRAHCPPVMDQGALGSCTAHGITGALRYELIRSGAPDVALARLQLYYDERAMEGTVSQDAGAEIRDGIKCAAKFGVAHESLWPYQISKFKTKPNKAVYADAVQFEALTYERVTVDASHVKAAIAEGYPVIVGLLLFKDFESEAVAATGMLPMPKRGATEIGGHCMYTPAYGVEPGRITHRNSWNTDWGDQGHVHIPEAYMAKYGSDFWIIKSAGRQGA